MKDLAYSDDYADLYDRFYRDKPYEAEAAFLDSHLQELALPASTWGAKLLDVACGTGEHCIAFEKLGYRPVGVDKSPFMIARARQKAKSTSIAAFFEGDMRDFSLDSEGKFDVSVCLFDSIGYVVTNDGLHDSLVNLGKHLRPGRLLALEFWHAPAMLKHHEPLRIKHFRSEDQTILRLSETSINSLDQTAEVSYTAYTLREDGTYSGIRETHVNRFFSVPEMDGWLTRTGLDALKWFPSFSDEQITDDSFQIVVIARAE